MICQGSFFRKNALIQYKRIFFENLFLIRYEFGDTAGMLVKSFNDLIMDETDGGFFYWKFCYFAAP